MGYIVPIFKSGDDKDPGNYRGITLLRCMGRLLTSKLNEYILIYCCFIDYSKAFDTTPRYKLWTKLVICNINGNILRLVQNLNEKPKLSFIINGKLSDSFPCQTGVRQGGSLSPLLLAI